MTENLVHELKFAFPDGEIEQWLALGAVVEGNVRAWVRSPGQSPVDVRLCVGQQVVATGSAPVEPGRDNTGFVDLVVPPEFAGEFATVEALGLTRELTLAPRSDAKVPFAFWFGSCNQPFDADTEHRMTDSPRARIYPLVERMAKQKGVRFGLLTGDQMYADEMPCIDVRAWAGEHPEVSDAELLDVYRQLYRGYFNQQGMRGLQEAFPSFLIWDDHEIMNSWGSQLELSDTDLRIQRAAWQSYREYQHVRNPGAHFDDDAPFHYSFWYASVGFFVFDLRGQRDYREGRVIGERQWAALDAFLEEATARGVQTVFAITSIPLVHFSPRFVQALDRLPGHNGNNTRDRWDATETMADRDRLLETIFDWQAARPGRNLSVLSGDVHAGAAFTVNRKGPKAGVFAQWTASALSSPGGVLHTLANRFATMPVNVGDHDRHAIRHGVEPRNNAGIVEITPRQDAPGHTVSLSIYGFDPKKGRLQRTIRHTLP